LLLPFRVVRGLLFSDFAGRHSVQDAKSMPLQDFKELCARALAALREALRAHRLSAPLVTSLTHPRKLAPIDDLVARIGRDPLPPN
jgi:hypothetical protein